MMLNLKEIFELLSNQGVEKPHFFQNLAKNEMFGSTKEAYWLSEIS